MEPASAKANFIVESIVEKLEAKQALFSKLDAVCALHTTIASNTSSLLPSTLAAATQRPDRFVVAHYFNPSYLMPLVEIVRGQLNNRPGPEYGRLYRNVAVGWRFEITSYSLRIDAAS